MKFWDASAMVPLLVEEPLTSNMESLLKLDGNLIAWWGSTVECVSALSRRNREGSLSELQTASAIARLRALAQAWHEVIPSESVRQTAQRLLRVHPLRAADSLQLAACLAACNDDPESVQFVCLDQRLSDAARREGIDVVASFTD